MVKQVQSDKSKSSKKKVNLKRKPKPILYEDSGEEGSSEEGLSNMEPDSPKRVQ